MSGISKALARLCALAAMMSVLLVGGSTAALAETAATVEGEGEAVNLRAGPGTDTAVVGSVPDGATVTIVCTARGTTETGPWGATDVWDRLDTGAWISDAFVATGTFDPVEPACDGGDPDPPPATGGGFASIDGAAEYGISQEFMAYGQVNPEWYAYVAAHCLPWGHHGGIDIATPDGTPLYSPVAGTVLEAGGTGFFQDARGDGPGVGELHIVLDNGDELILGHMARIDVGVGGRVEPGTPVGLSGTYNGDHVHVEYRTPDASCTAGTRIVDPAAALG